MDKPLTVYQVNWFNLIAYIIKGVLESTCLNFNVLFSMRITIPNRLEDHFVIVVIKNLFYKFYFK